ncbi:hypothetical protein [Treponema saccharophilum]
MENAKHLPPLLRFSLTKKANSSLKEEFALEITNKNENRKRKF